MGFRERLFGSAAGSKCTTDDFEVTLPVGWEAAHEPTHYGFVRQASGDQITLSAQRARQVLDKPTLLVAALDLVALRQNAFRSVSGGAASFTEPESTDVDDGMDITFGVVDASAQVQSRVWVLARPRRIVTLAFNHYSPLLEPAALQKRCSEIRAAVTIK